MNQKGFIPLIIIIIASIVVVSAGAGVVFHKQGKLAPLIANISEVFKGTKEATTREEQEIKPEETQREQESETSQEEVSQTEQELEQVRLEAEKAKAEAEQLKAERLETQRLTEDQKQKEQQSLTYKKNILEIQNLIIKLLKEHVDCIKLALQATNIRLDSLNNMVDKNRIMFIDNPSVSGDIKMVAEIFNEAWEEDIQTTEQAQNFFESDLKSLEKLIKANQNTYNSIIAINTTEETITHEKYVDFLTVLKKTYSDSLKIKDSDIDTVNKYIDYVERTNQDYKDIIAYLQQHYSSESSQLQQTFRIEPSDPSSFSNSIMNDFYRQEQIRALNNIADQLNNIWGELIYP